MGKLVDLDKLIGSVAALRRSGVLAVSFHPDGSVAGVQLSPPAIDLDQDWPGRDLVMSVEEVNGRRQ